MSTRRGVDLSSWQGAPGQWAGTAGRISFAGVKVTELYPDGRRYVNPDAAADAAYLKAHGKARIFYLFAHPGAPAEETVRFFAGQLAALGLEDSDSVCVDLEQTDGRSPDQVSSWAVWVMAALRKQFGRPTLLYTYLSFAEEGHCAGLGHYPLWIADPSSPPGEPRVPHPWKTWAIHQYSIAGAIDRDILGYPNATAMRAALGKPGAKHAKNHPLKTVARKTAHGGRKVKGKVKQEPVMTAGTAASVLAPLAAYLQHKGLHLTVTQLNAALTIIVALAGCATALTARPVRMGAYTAALGTLATATQLFWMHVPPQWIGYQVPVAALLTGLLLRAHVSPKWEAIPLAVVQNMHLPPAPAATAAVPVPGPLA